MEGPRKVPLHLPQTSGECQCDSKNIGYGGEGEESMAFSQGTLTQPDPHNFLSVPFSAY